MNNGPQAISGDDGLDELLQGLHRGILTADELDRTLVLLESRPDLRARLDAMQVEDPLLQAVRAGFAPPSLQENECGNSVISVANLADSSSTSGDRTRLTTDTAERPATAADLNLREIGQYRIRELLGRGGMGSVYKGVHPQLDKVVAIKLLKEGLASDSNAVARFEREMKAVGRLDHPNIVRATDAGTASGHMYLVMEFLDGIDLRQLVDEQGPLSIPNACEIIRQAAVGLHYAHQAGLVHRDIKPNNISVTSLGLAKVLDLGLARLTEDEAGESPQLTQTSQVCGTYDYMPPEQWESTHSVDHRGDIYSLGCTLYFLLAGRAPFDDPKYQGSYLSKMKAHIMEPVPSIREQRADVPDGLVHIIEHMTAKEQTERYQSAADVANDLTQYCQGSHIAALIDPNASPTEAAVGYPTAISSGSGRTEPAWKSGSQSSVATAAPASGRGLWLIGGGLTVAVAVVGIVVAQMIGANAGRNSVPSESDLAVAGVLPPKPATPAAGSSSPESTAAMAGANSQDSTQTPPPTVKPIIASVADQRIVEEQQFSVALRVTNGDALPGSLQFSLSADAPEGVFVQAKTGAVSWKPTEAQGPGKYPITILVSSDNAAVEPATLTFTLDVQEANVAPVMEPLENLSVEEGATVKFVARARDADLPANGLRYSLGEDAPEGAVIDPASGRVSWTPTEAQGPGEYVLTVRATDDGQPARFDFKTVTIKVSEVNQPPVVDVPSEHRLGPNERLDFIVRGSDPDLPAVDVTYRLGDGAPTTATLDRKTGAFHWVSKAEDVGKTYTFPVIVTEVGPKPLETSRTLTVHVERYVRNSIGMALAYVPAGRFRMGSLVLDEDNVAALLGFSPDTKGSPPKGTTPPASSTKSGKAVGGEAFSDERPVRIIEFSRPLHVGAYEVTQAEYEQVMGRNPSHFAPQGRGADQLKGVDNPAQLPVESITWDDAVTFCRKLSELPAEKAAGRVYRLPTEAEWEYFCRADTGTKFAFGNQLSSSRANFDGTTGWQGAPAGPFLKRTAAVGSYAPNAWGLYDVHGNVAEWCADWYSPKAYEVTETLDPKGPGPEEESVVQSGRHRVVRGGGWNEIAAYLRAAQRGHSRTPNSSIGLRVVCETRKTEPEANK